MTSLSPQPKTAREFLPELYDQLKSLAQRHLQGEKPWHTLQATALVHEAYLKLAGTIDQPLWNDARHFYLAAAEAMRQILIDHARRKGRLKRGGGQTPAHLEPDQISQPSWDHLTVSDLLEQLAQVNPSAAELVKLRVFIGLTMEEASQVLSWSISTTERRWVYAKALLQQAITENS